MRTLRLSRFNKYPACVPAVGRGDVSAPQPQLVQWEFRSSGQLTGDPQVLFAWIEALQIATPSLLDIVLGRRNLSIAEGAIGFTVSRRIVLAKSPDIGKVVHVAELLTHLGG